MKPLLSHETEHSKSDGSWMRRLVVGSVMAVGLAVLAGAPAEAKNWKHGHGYNGGGYYSPDVVYLQPRPVYVQPQPIYVQPRPVYYVQPRPVYYQPRPVYYQPRPVYVQPQPVYQRPSLNLVFPLDFD